MHHDYRKDARLPEQLQRAMAAEAEASREARAKVIAADGEKRASNALREASRTIDESPSALQLRYLQVRPILRHCIHTYLVDVLWGQPIKLIRCLQLQNCVKINGMTFFSLKLLPVISSGLQSTNIK